ncbi:metal ABC transporter permease, partial [Proteus mirabilis]|nr:metal ABC transporter permease [Proteus mirabilis]
MNELMEFFIEPFQYPFMQRAIIAAVIIGIACAILSCYMVLKGWSLMGDAISHAVLPGVVLAYVTAIPLTIGAFLSGLFCSFATGYLKEHSRIKEDTVMGIVFSGMFAVGLVIFASVDTDQHLMHILFGNILGITPDVLIQISAICLITITIMLVKQKDFMLYCFDPNQARIVGLPVA